MAANELGKKGKPGPDVEKQPAVERGERIDTGKAIHRGGKPRGHVPGATGQPQKEERHAEAEGDAGD